ncbi:MAG TPA: hypothetical protein VFL03_07970 [Candidatus Limnocylindrales bacterium]|jgi:hypothetical protein|nr:hypothetical protein [Candidatus Limnocylindrales bacterium]
MALDALRSTFNFKRPSAPTGPIPGWGQAPMPDAPPAPSPELTVPPASDPVPYQATSYAPPAPAPWEAEKAPWDVQRTPWDAEPTPDDLPVDSDADTSLVPEPEPYGLPVQAMSDTTFAVPPVSPELLAAAPAQVAPAQPAPAPAAAPAGGTSSYAADQYAAVFADPIAGGGTGEGSFGCPKCGRTLDRGTFRCEDCKTFLVLGQPLRLVAPFIAGGLVIGILVTTLLTNLFAPPKAAPVAGLDGAIGGTGAGTVAGSLDIPSGAAAALRGTTAINGRLAAEATTLRKALDAKKFRPGDVQKVLRRMAIDARAGTGMLTTLAAWPEAAGQQAALDAFYADLQRQIDGGLNASVRSAGPYKKAAKAILATLERTPDLDADARTLAGQSGIELAPVEFPKSLR